MKIILKVYRSKTPLTCQTTPTFGNNPNMLIYSQRAELPQRTTISSMWQTATNLKSLHNSLRIKVFNASNCYQRTKQNSIYQTAPNVLIYLQRDDLPLTCWATTNMLIYPNLPYYHFPLCTLNHPAQFILVLLSLSPLHYLHTFQSTRRSIPIIAFFVCTTDIPTDISVYNRYSCLNNRSIHAQLSFRSTRRSTYTQSSFLFRRPIYPSIYTHIVVNSVCTTVLSTHNHYSWVHNQSTHRFTHHIATYISIYIPTSRLVFCMYHTLRFFIDTFVHIIDVALSQSATFGCTTQHRDWISSDTTIQNHARHHSQKQKHHYTSATDNDPIN